MINFSVVALILLIFTGASYAAKPKVSGATQTESIKINNKPSKAVKSHSRVDLESQVIEGQIYRPEFSVVTGDLSHENQGILRLRENFDDHDELEKLNE